MLVGVGPGLATLLLPLLPLLKVTMAAALAKMSNSVFWYPVACGGGLVQAVKANAVSKTAAHFRADGVIVDMFPPVDGRNHPAQRRRRAVATIRINSESPAYSRGGDQSAGFYGYGI